MPEFVRVASVADIPPGSRYYHDFDYETVVVFNVNGQFYAIADVCTHDGGPLADGVLDGCAIECPRHGARFDIRTGAVLCLPAVTPVPTYAVKVAGEDVLVESPDDDW